VKLLQLTIVVMFAAAAFVVTVSVVAANARPEPPPCNDTFIVDTPAHGSGVDRDATGSCAAPEAPAWLVLGAGSVAAAGVIVGYSLIVRRPRGAAKELAQQPS
jgi:hypothetical protein